MAGMTTILDTQEAGSICVLNHIKPSKFIYSEFAIHLGGASKNWGRHDSMIQHMRQGLEPLFYLYLFAFILLVLSRK